MTILEKALLEAGAEVEISAPGEMFPGEPTPTGFVSDRGVVAVFPDGTKFETGFRMVDNKGYRTGWSVPERRTDDQVWEDAEKDLLSDDACWYDPYGYSIPCPFGGRVGSVEEFALLLAALLPCRR
jgi:hypothetical protein